MTELRFSANLGFLWKALPLAERIESAATTGFDAVEFHDEVRHQNVPQVKQALENSGLSLIALNVRAGSTRGCAALPGHAAQAREDIARAVEFGETLGAGAIHILSGKTELPAARACYQETLAWALEQTTLTLLIEPISLPASPGYFMHDLAMAAQVVDELANDRLRILFDCFHVRELHGVDVAGAYHRHAQRIGHVQIASWPARAEPGSSHDELDYANLLPAMQASGYGGAFGCEYHPQTTVEAGLEWRNVICRKVEFAATP